MCFRYKVCSQSKGASPTRITYNDAAAYGVSANNAEMLKLTAIGIQNCISLFSTFNLKNTNENNKFLGHAQRVCMCKRLKQMISWDCLYKLPR